MTPPGPSPSRNAPQATHVKTPHVTLPDEIPRKLSERTGVHRCVKCLREVPSEEFFRLDHLCGSCTVAEEEFPLASTPERGPGERKA